MNTLTFQKNASYALTIKRELEKNLVLETNEKLIYQDKVRFFGFIFSHMGYFALTNMRIAFIKHFQFRPDIFYSVNLKDIIDVKIVSDFDLIKSTVQKYLNLFNHLTTGDIKIIHLTYLESEAEKTFDFFCWNYKVVYKSMGWKPDNNKTDMLHRKIMQQLKN